MTTPANRRGYETPFLTAVSIMAYRQVKRFLRMRARMVMALIQPLVWMLFFGLGWSSTLRGPMARQVLGGLSYLEFLAPGVAMMTVFGTSFFAGASVVWDREFGFLKEVLVAPASRKAIILGRALGDSLVAIAQGLVTFAIACALAGRVNLVGLPLLVAAMFLTALAHTSLGIAIGSLVTSMEAFQLIVNLISMPTIFLSGTVFPLKMAPEWMKNLSMLIPLTYGVDAARSATFGGALIPLWLDMAVLSALALALVLLSAKAFERATLA